jgi:branched-chain amino acid transport system permease protein
MQIQDIVNGLMSGWIYVLVALGLTLVLSIVGIVQLAHGGVYMVGAYVAYYFCGVAGFNFFLALAVSIVSVGLLGIVLEKVLLRSFRGNMDGAIISTIALILILQTAVVLIAGTGYKATPSHIEGVLTVFSARLSLQRLITILISVVLVSGLLVFINKTRMGQAMVAVSEDRDAAALQGINVNRVCSIAMFLGCGLAAAAGALVGSIFHLSPFMGDFALMKGIAVIILGGLGSILGAVIGGLILGLVDGLITPVLSVGMADMIGLIIIILILLSKPQGLFGHDHE